MIAYLVASKFIFSMVSLKTVYGYGIVGKYILLIGSSAILYFMDTYITTKAALAVPVAPDMYYLNYFYLPLFDNALRVVGYVKSMLDVYQNATLGSLETMLSIGAILLIALVEPISDYSQLIQVFTSTAADYTWIPTGILYLYSVNVLSFNIIDFVGSVMIFHDQAPKYHIGTFLMSLKSFISMVMPSVIVQHQLFYA
ncbi:hypothetical protein FGO68_gene14139 [Halteria grandinella]|uniref:Uncharacterized protein n=1 Tax=Halteria grandinella TaxID=5974 RepID=A0A8J8NJJ2_HALGN|nr:hypothetical protein FGO68_gene14139 [Halteria grandinella]